MWFVYMLRCSNGSLYVGETTDVAQRVADHRRGRGSAHTAKHRPVQLAYAIAQRLRQVSREVVNVTQGTLYPALHRLENRGFLAADWKQSDTGRDAKFYRLTAKGRAHMASEAESWRRLAQAVGAILKTSEGV